ncbi:MAG: RNA polymerase sigma factor [Planctomycetes bacterium]|nr:RNA polymerase sigma factor [Planctomycetota bacterium]
MSGPDDETVSLLRRWHGGDRAALAALVERDRDWVEQAVRRRRGPNLQRLSETHDDVQDLMLKALQYSPRFLCRDRGQFRALIARMIENMLVDRSRSAAARHPERHYESLSAESRLALDPGVPTDAEPGAEAARDEEFDWMRLGLEFLDADDRDLIRRRQLLEQSFVEIAGELGVPANTLRMRFNRAMLRLAGIVQRLQHGELRALLGDDGEH